MVKVTVLMAKVIDEGQGHKIRSRSYIKVIAQIFTVQFQHPVCQRCYSEVFPVIYVFIARPHFRGKLPQTAHFANRHLSRSIALRKLLKVQFQLRRCRRGPCEVSAVIFVYIAHSHFIGKVPQIAHFAQQHFLCCL